MRCSFGSSPASGARPKRDSAPATTSRSRSGIEGVAPLWAPNQFSKFSALSTILCFTVALPSPARAGGNIVW
eukprot:scaffold143_cov110-Isochrysis_galbana.AAC.5